MASLEFDGFDTILDDLKIIEIECPDCGQPFEISLDDVGSTVTCPHCETNIELESV